MVEKKKFGYKTLSDKQERQSSIIKDLTEEDELEEKSYISDSEEPEEQDRKLKKRKRPSSPQIELAILSSSSPSLATTRISGTCKRSTSPTVDITASTSVITTKPDERDDPQRRYKFMDVRDVSHPFVPPKIRLATEKPRITIAPIENKLKPAMVSPRILNYRSPISKTPGGHNAEADKSNTSSGCGNIESGKNCKSDHFSKQHKNINYGSRSQMNFNGESSLNGINRNHNSSKPEDNGCKTKELLSKKLENSNLIFRKRSDKGWIKETVKPRVSRK
ncbi:hypothetical protein BY996DRAFT_3115380 [Phakopsora pachyrhizi]|nr:hypothetical protein BY996DRAFT_3115380 [Phakopsora pachyrhizi]